MEKTAVKKTTRGKKENECVGIMRWGRWRGGGGGGGEECSSDPPIDRVQLDWLHRPHLLSALLCPPITPLSSPSPLAPPSVPLAGAKVIDSENVVIAFDCQLKWQL